MRGLLLGLLLLPTAVNAGSDEASVATLPPSFRYITPEMDRLLMKGVDDIYRMRFDEAEAAARGVIALNPEHPHAYMGLSAVAWTRYVYGADQSDPELLVPYEKTTREAIAKAEAWIKKHPDDAQAMMVLGAAYGLYSRLLLTRREWLKGYWYGRKALSFTQKSARLDPQFVDAQLGLGMYDYYSDLYPRVVGVLAKIVLRGNRRRGIELLQRVAERGHFSKSNGMILLVEIYTEDPFGARNPAQAVELMRKLREKYPDSAMMHSAQLVALYAAERHDEVVVGAKDYLARVSRGLYPPLESAKGHVMLGCGLWAAGRRDEALAAFREAAKVRYKNRLSRWAVWALIRAGNLLDTMGRRKEALESYRAALSAQDLWEFRRLAKPRLSKPWSGAPGPMPPPS